jgi:hypothetical protein
MSGQQANRSVVILFQGDLERDLFNTRLREGCHEPYILWKDRLIERGYRVEAAADQRIEDVAAVVFWDGDVARGSTGLGLLKARIRGRAHGIRRNWLGQARRAGIPVVLILWEPPVVRPRNWDSRLLRRFPRVLTYDDDLVDGQRFLKYNNPLRDGRLVLEGRQYGERRMLASVSGNKSSEEPGELYSSRVASFVHFAGRPDISFDMFGRGWDKPPAVPVGTDAAALLAGAYAGACVNKLETLSGYRFAIAYENSLRPRGYVTEKVFDCLRAGCVPIYLGPDNVFDYVDKEAVIDRRAFGSDQELGDYLLGVSEAEWEAMRAAGRAYVQGERFTPFLPECFVAAVDAALGL